MNNDYINRLKQCVDDNNLLEFIEIYDEDIIYIDENNNTILHYVVQKNNYDMTRFLLQIIVRAPKNVLTFL